MQKKSKEAKPISASMIDTYRACPMLFNLKYNFRCKTKETSKALLTGSIIGEIIEALLLDCDVASEEIKEEHISKIKKRYAEKLENNFIAIDCMIDLWRATNHEEKIYCIETEAELSCSLYDRNRHKSKDHFCYGHADAIVCNDEEEYFIYELKTTSDTVDSVVDYLRNGLQIWYYLAIAKKMFPNRNWRGVVVDVLKKPLAKDIKKRSGRKTKSDETNQDVLERVKLAFDEDKQKYYRRVYFDDDQDKQDQAMLIASKISKSICRDNKTFFCGNYGMRCKLAFGWCDYIPICWRNNFDDEKFYIEDENIFDGKKKKIEKKENAI